MNMKNKYILEILMLLFNKIPWTLSIKTSDFVDETEAIETNSITTSFFSLSYALRNDPIISFLAADVASSANIAKSTAFIRVFIDFSFRWELRATSIESQESEESYAAFLGHVSRDCLIIGSLISSDKNLNHFWV